MADRATTLLKRGWRIDVDEIRWDEKDERPATKQIRDDCAASGNPNYEARPSASSAGISASSSCPVGAT